MLTWTIEPPKQTGWYWRKEVCYEKNYREAIVIVQIFECHLFGGGMEIHKQNDNASTLYWAGPIPEPEE